MERAETEITSDDVRRCCSCDAELVQEHWSELLDVPADFMGGSSLLVFSSIFCTFQFVAVCSFLFCWLLTETL